MEFLYPGFLYALAALAVPIIIHLFNFRRFKKIPFTNVRFLRDIKQKTRSQNKLRHLLTLLARMAALAFLVLAFAQPFIPADEAERVTDRRTVAVFLDNSFSMEGESEAGPLIDVAKNRALDIAAAHEPTDRFLLLTHDFDGRHSRPVSRQVFTDLVQETDLSPKSRSYAEINSRLRDLLSNAAGEGKPKAYIISDFQKSRFDFAEVPPDTLYERSLVHLERNDLSNLYIDSVWFDTPVRKLGEADVVRVRVVNAGEAREENIPLRLDVNGIKRAVASVDADPGEKVSAALEFVHEKPGVRKAAVEITDNPVTYDDTYYFSYDVFEEIPILAIRENSDAPDPLRGVFSGDSVYTYHTVNPRGVDYSNMGTYSLIILDRLNEIPGGLAGELRSFIENGGTAWIIPSAEIDLPSYNAFFAETGARPFSPLIEAERKVLSLNTEHPLYRGVFERITKNMDLPEVKRFYPAVRTSGGDPVMRLAGGDPFLTAYASGRGNLYIQHSGLSRSDNNFSRHALFVATALRIGELSGSSGIRSIWAEDDAYFTVPAFRQTGGQSIRLVNEEAGADVIPLYRRSEGRFFISPGPEISSAGNYSLIYNDEQISAVGINYLREESDLSSFTREELAAIAETTEVFKIFDGTSDNLTAQIEQVNRGTPLWKLCLILVLLFLLAETLLLRIRKSPVAA